MPRNQPDDIADLFEDGSSVDGLADDGLPSLGRLARRVVPYVIAQGIAGVALAACVAQAMVPGVVATRPMEGFALRLASEEAAPIPTALHDGFSLRLRRAEDPGSRVAAR